MISKIEHGYVHVRGGKPGGIFEIEDFDIDELRENKAILKSLIDDIWHMTSIERAKIEDTIKKLTEEIEKRINVELERRR